MRTLVLAVAAFLTLGPVPESAFSVPATAAPACNGWTLHTRTLPTICPEVVVDALPGILGMVTIGGLTFDSGGALYVSDTATGQVIRLTRASPGSGQFDAPQSIASGLNLPGGLACSSGTDAACYAATDTAIVRLSDGGLLVSDLSSDGLRPLRIGPDGRLYTTQGGKPISLASDGSDIRPAAQADSLAPAADLAWAANGVLWASDGLQTVRAVDGSALTFDPQSAPTGIAFYPNSPGMAFPQFADGLLVVTSGSWDTPTIAGYELWLVPFASGHPSTPQRLIPADTERSSSDAALVALSFFPDHPVAVAVSAEGWIYVATREGRIVRLRPRP